MSGARRLWWAAALGWAGLIAVLLLLPPGPGSSGWFDFAGADKLLHAGSFLLLALLLERATRSTPAALALASLYGAVTELLQLGAPGRSADLFDWLADTGGAALALAAVSFLRRSRAAVRVE